MCAFVVTATETPPESSAGLLNKLGVHDNGRTLPAKSCPMGIMVVFSSIMILAYLCHFHSSIQRGREARVVGFISIYSFQVHFQLAAPKIQVPVTNH